MKDKSHQNPEIKKILARATRMLGPVLDSIPDYIHILDREYRVIYANRKLIQAHRENAPGRPLINETWTDAFPFLDPGSMAYIKGVFLSGKTFIKEDRITVHNRTIFAHTRIVPIFSGKKVTHVLNIVEDITEKREMEELKHRSEEQKDLLIHEIHHRVKNSLSIVASLLHLQLKRSGEPGIRKILQDIEMRIRSMSLTFELLYKSESFDRIPLARYISAVASAVRSMHHAYDVTLKLDLSEADAGIETANPLGLILCELLSNAIHYGRTPRGKCILSVGLKKERKKGFLRLTVSDTGPGVPPGISLNDAETMGFFVVRLLSEQLDGKISMTNTNGASFTLVFPNPRQDQAKK